MSFSRDMQDILFYGKRYKHPMIEPEKRDSYLKRAARLYACTDDRQKQGRLMRWWIEGVRDYCQDQKEIEQMQDILLEEAAQHITQGRY